MINRILPQNFSNLYIISILTAILAILALSTYTIFILSLLLVVVYKFYDRRFIISLTILAFILVTRSEFESYRSAIVISSTLLLLFLFFKFYGFKINAYPSLPKEVVYFLILVVLTLVVSTTFSKDLVLSLIASIRLLVFFIICFVFYTFIDGISTVYQYLYTLLIAGFIASLAIYFDFINIGFSFFLSSGILARFTGLFDNPNFIGLITLISTCLVVGFLHIPKFKLKKVKLILLSLLLSNIFIFLIVASRAAIIGSIIGTTFILFVLNKKTLLKLSIIVSTVVVIISVLFPSIIDFILIVIRWQDFGIREYLWDAGVLIFKDNFLTGVGPQMFPNTFYTYFPSSIYSVFQMRYDLQDKVFHPHNFHLLMASENGILGLMVSLSTFILFFFLAAKAVKLSKNLNYEYYILSLTFIAIGIGVFFRSFFEVSGVLNYGYISRDLPFWIIFISLAYIYKDLLRKRNKIK